MANWKEVMYYTQRMVRKKKPVCTRRAEMDTQMHQRKDHMDHISMCVCAYMSCTCTPVYVFKCVLEHIMQD